jgi:DNA-binding response OmpR family regulator
VTAARVVILSSDSYFFRSVNDYLGRHGFEIVDRPPANVIVADVDSLSSSLRKQVTQLRRFDESVALILVTARWPNLSRLHAWRPCGYVRKPFNMADLLRVVGDLVAPRSGRPQEVRRDSQVQSGHTKVA